MPKTTTGSSRKLAPPIVALALFLVGWGSSIAHAGNHDESLTAEHFLSRIDDNLPELDRLGANVLAAEAAIAEAQALPGLGISYEREEVFSEGEGLVQKSAMSVGWSLDLSGRRGQLVQSAELVATATRESNTHETHLLRMRALEVYYQAVRGKLRAASLRRTRAPLVELVERLKRRVGEGDASGYDLARFELELSEHDDQLAEAEAKYSIAQKRLAGLLGASGQKIDPIDPLDPPTAPTGESVPIDRGDVLAASHLAASGRALARAAGRWWVPTLDLSVGYMNTDLGPGSGPGADLAHGYTAMVTANVPIFSRGRAEGKRGEARVRHAQATKSIIERNILVETQSAEELLRSQLERSHQYSKRQVVQVATLVQKTQAAYLGGEASALELRDTYRQAVVVELRHIDLRFQSRMAAIELWRVTGASDIGGNQ